MPNRRMRNFSSFLTIIFFLLFTGSIFGETTLLEKVKAKFAAEQSFSVSIVVNNSGQSGKIYFQSPDYEKIIFGDYKISVIADTIWNYNKKIKRLVIQEKEENFSPFSIYDILFKLPKECSYTENKKEGEFTLIPNDEDELNVKSVNVKVKRNSLPVFIEVIDLNGEKFSFKLKNYSFNSRFNKNFFKIELPKGTKVVDLR